MEDVGTDTDEERDAPGAGAGRTMTPSVPGMTLSEIRECLSEIRANPALRCEDRLSSGLLVGVFATRFLVGCQRKRRKAAMAATAAPEPRSPRKLPVRPSKQRGGTAQRRSKTHRPKESSKRDVAAAVDLGFRPPVVLSGPGIVRASFSEIASSIRTRTGLSTIVGRQPFGVPSVF